MNTAFTPGPWTVSPGSVTTIIETGPLKRSIAHADDLSIRCSNKEYDERDANARLIAAAPDLLAALQSMVDWANADPSGTYPGGYPGTKAAAAIAKAVQV